jgi:DNA-binding transcriptional LysR family regulator
MNMSHARQNPLDSRQLNAFASLARTGSFAETARELFLTHSAISHSIKALEREVGCRLLNRLGKKIELTAAGEGFLLHVQDGLKGLALAREYVEQYKEWGCPRLRIGAGTALCQRLFPLVLTQLRQQFPRMLVSARTVRASEMAACLAAGELEIIVAPALLHAPEQEFTPLFESTLQIVVSAKHRWAVDGSVPFKEIPKEPCFLPDKTHATRRVIDQYFAADKVVLNGVAEIDNLDVIRETLKHGIGMSILPDWLVKEDLAAGALVGFPPGRRRLRQSWGFLRSVGRPITSIESSFQILCAEAVKSLQSNI